jgi:hypothetical protein
MLVIAFPHRQRRRCRLSPTIATSVRFSLPLSLFGRERVIKGLVAKSPRPIGKRRRREAMAERRAEVDLPCAAARRRRAISPPRKGHAESARSSRTACDGEPPSTVFKQCPTAPKARSPTHKPDERGCSFGPPWPRRLAVRTTRVAPRRRVSRSGRLLRSRRASQSHSYRVRALPTPRELSKIWGVLRMTSGALCLRKMTSRSTFEMFAVRDWKQRAQQERWDRGRPTGDWLSRPSVATNVGAHDRLLDAAFA